MRRSAGPAIHVVGSMMIDRVVRVRALPRAGETVAAQSSATFAGGKGANQAAASAMAGSISTTSRCLTPGACRAAPAVMPLARPMTRTSSGVGAN